MRTRTRAMASAVLLLTALLGVGCAGPATIEPDGTLVRHYVGYVKVVVPQAAGKVCLMLTSVKPREQHGV